MLTLHDLAEAYRRLADADEGEEYAEALAQLRDGDLTEKAENVAAVIRSLEANAEAAETEAQRLQRRATALKNRADDLKRYLLESLTLAGLRQVRGTLFTVSVQASPPSCRVVDPAAVPDAYQVTLPPVVKVDQKAIIARWRESGGEQVPGAVVEQGSHLRIR